jgi:predicted heme/steroid binding protein
VAVKGTVYEIKDSKYWQNGEHTPSSGQGICGADMTEVIKGAPHGESMLERLPKVGTYQ